MKIIILIITCKLEPYISLTDTIKNTWAYENFDNIDIYYCYGDSEKLYVKNNEIYCPCIDNEKNIGNKTLMSFEWLLNNKKFDYIFRSNTSSYINQKKLLEFITDKPINNFYSGIIGYDNEEKIYFASGSGYFLSRDLVKLVVDNKNVLDYNILDDVALGKFLTKYQIINYPFYRRLNIEISESGYLKIYRAELLPDEKEKICNENKILENLTLDDFNNDTYHFRCKCCNRYDDIKIMKKLHQLLT